MRDLDNFAKADFTSTGNPSTENVQRCINNGTSKSQKDVLNESMGRVQVGNATGGGTGQRTSRLPRINSIGCAPTQGRVLDSPMWAERKTVEMGPMLPFHCPTAPISTLVTSSRPIIVRGNTPHICRPSESFTPAQSYKIFTLDATLRRVSDTWHIDAHVYAMSPIQFDILHAETPPSDLPHLRRMRCPKLPICPFQQCHIFLPRETDHCVTLYSV